MTYQQDIATVKAGSALAKRLLKTKTASDDEVHRVGEAVEAAVRVEQTQAKIASDQELRRKLADVLREESIEPGMTGRFSVKTATRAITEQMRPVGGKALAPSGSVVSPAGLTVPQPIPMDRPARGLLAVLPAQQVTQPPSVSFMRQTAWTNNAAVVASGAVKPTSVMTLSRVDDVLKVVATLSESDRSILVEGLRSGSAVGRAGAARQRRHRDRGARTELPLGSTSGVQVQSFSTDIAETLRKAMTKVQIIGGSDPIAVLHPADYEALCLLRSAGPEKLFVGSSSITQTVPGGEVSPPTGASALLSWGMPVALSVAATPGEAWVIGSGAITLFVDGQALIDWSDGDGGFAKNQVIGRAETRVYPAVVKPVDCVKTDVSAA